MRRDTDGGPASARRRDALTGAAALAAHAALLALAFAVHTSPPPASQGADTGQAEIEIDLRESAPREAPPQPTALPEPQASAVPRELGRNSGAGRETLPDLPQATSPEVAPSAVASSTAAPGATGDVWGSAPAVPMAGGELAIGPSIWGVPGALPSGPDTAAASLPDRSPPGWRRRQAPPCCATPCEPAIASSASATPAPPPWRMPWPTPCAARTSRPRRRRCWWRASAATAWCCRSVCSSFERRRRQVEGRAWAATAALGKRKLGLAGPRAERRDRAGERALHRGAALA